VLWGVGVVVFGLPCPLTEIEHWARAKAGMDPLPTSGFTGRYVDGVFYPTNRTGAAQAFAFAAAGLSWVAIASKTRRRNSTRVAAFPAAVICPRSQFGEPRRVHVHSLGGV
jgi:hypothetical protein